MSKNIKNAVRFAHTNRLKSVEKHFFCDIVVILCIKIWANSREKRSPIKIVELKHKVLRYRRVDAKDQRKFCGIYAF